MRTPPKPVEIQDLQASEIPIILALNNAHAAETSLLDEAGLRSLLALCAYERGIDHGSTALLLALDQNALYANPNFAWFKARHSSFLYIDRVIVSRTARGQGLARKLYLDLFARAIEAGHRRVVCEINADPPNPASDAFHEAMGFKAVGAATIHNGTKTVLYFEKLLS